MRQGFSSVRATHIAKINTPQGEPKIPSIEEICDLYPAVTSSTQAKKIRDGLLKPRLEQVNARFTETYGEPAAAAASSERVTRVRFDDANLAKEKRGPSNFGKQRKAT